jgi:hypothetical protein
MLAESETGDVGVMGAPTEMDDLPCDVVVRAAGVGIRQPAALDIVEGATVQMLSMYRPDRFSWSALQPAPGPRRAGLCSCLTTG